jgi:hypothetical protein
MNLRVNLTKRISTPDGFRYCPVVMAANGRVKPGAVIVDGKEEKHPEGSYYIDWYEGDKRKRRSVGTDPASAFSQKLNRETKLRAASQGIALETEASAVAGRSIATAVATFHKEAEDVRRLLEDACRSAAGL